MQVGSEHAVPSATIEVPRELATKVEVFLQEVAAGIEDEGDRAYFSSTNQADALRELSREVTLAMYDIMYAESDRG